MTLRMMLAGLATALAIQASRAKAEDNIVHNGMTAAELTAFGQREGWDVDDVLTSGTTVTFRIDGVLTHIQLYDCHNGGRCRSGVIRDISYHFLEPTRYGFWHWNLGARGATGFGPSYVTLQRFIHLAGVTDQYLREVIGDVWRDAHKSFWLEVRRKRDEKP